MSTSKIMRHQRRSGGVLWKDARDRIPNRINVNMRNHEGATALYYAASGAPIGPQRSR
jgi:hypothetical protein